VLRDVPGVRVGHWHDEAARTGCTVVLLPEGTTASAEVRGGAPATRELALLEPERTVARLDAVVLTGGSAFGLAAADGVMRWCEEQGIGVATPAGRVPIVAALALFDLAVGDAAVRPGPAEGYAACLDARQESEESGPVGAGCGATVDKWLGPDRARRAGLGTATMRRGELVVSALLAVNAYGSIDHDGTSVARAVAEGDTGEAATATVFTNTTIGVVVTNARLDKVGCKLVAQGGHGGLSRALVPSHTRADGDALIAAATGAVEADVDVVRLLAVAAVESAVRTLRASA
jgi:L-aminopeptidase/D-esterase-like protein